jgi:hypothetical protein
MFAGSAAYENWALKFPQHVYVGASQEKVQSAFWLKTLPLPQAGFSLSTFYRV